MRNFWSLLVNTGCPTSETNESSVVPDPLCGAPEKLDAPSFEVAPSRGAGREYPTGRNQDNLNFVSIFESMSFHSRSSPFCAQCFYCFVGLIIRTVLAPPSHLCDMTPENTSYQTRALGASSLFCFCKLAV